MSTPAHPPASEEVPQQLLLVFAPLHKRAMGLAIGGVTGLLVFAATVFTLFQPVDRRVPLWLLNNYFFGYEISWTGAFIGLLWGALVGFVFGWFFAFCRNFIVATWLFIVRTREELTASRDFLDHI